MDTSPFDLHFVGAMDDAESAMAPLPSCPCQPENAYLGAEEGAWPERLSSSSRRLCYWAGWTGMRRKEFIEDEKPDALEFLVYSCCPLHEAAMTYSTKKSGSRS